MSGINLPSFGLGCDPVFSAIGDGGGHPASNRDAAATTAPPDAPQPEEVVA